LNLEKLEIRLDNGKIELIDKWKSKERDVPSRSEAFQRLIINGTNKISSDIIHLRRVDLLITWLLTSIIKIQINEIKNGSLYNEEEGELKLIQSAITVGHIWSLYLEYNYLSGHIDRSETVAFVVDILDMWSFIEDGCDY